tara:strand:+ start:4500 stop:4697 length:198 start_codon:yes stop_codon:yes gene_type:complete
MKVGDLVTVKLGTGIYRHRNFIRLIGIVKEKSWNLPCSNGVFWIIHWCDNQTTHEEESWIQRVVQ